MPARIINDSAWSEVAYSPNKSRVKRRDSTGRQTLYVGAHYEQTTWGGITTRLHRIGDFAVYVEKLGLQQDSYYQYLHRDHLGSIVAKTNDQERDLERLANGPWGERRFWAWDGPTDPHFDPVDNRGFTGHEHLDPVGLIHMNGRVYDPELGRFLSPDPFVQAPFNTQSYNRYTYVFNNPLSYTDPSGYTSERCGYGTVNNQCAGGLNQADLDRIEEYEASKGGVDGEVVIRGSRWGNTVHTAFSGYYDVRDWQMSSGRHAQEDPYDLTSASYWAGLRAGFSPKVFGAKLILDLNLISHECNVGQQCTGNELTQGFTIGFAFKGNQFNILAANRSAEDSINFTKWGFDFFESAGRSGISVSRSPLSMGVGGGLLVGGDVEFDVGDFFKHHVFGTGHSGARRRIDENH